MDRHLRIARARSAQPASGVRILMADHNRRNIELALDAQARSGVGYDLRVVQDGEAVLEMLFPSCAAPAFLPDVIVMAIDLPPGNAMEIYRGIRASVRTSGIPVTLVMPSGCQDDLGMHHRVGDNTSVCSPAGLGETIEALGGLWGIFASLPPVA